MMVAQAPSISPKDAGQQQPCSISCHRSQTLKFFRQIVDECDNIRMDEWSNPSTTLDDERHGTDTRQPPVTAVAPQPWNAR
jgi:hypothetical protein